MWGKMHLHHFWLSSQIPFWLLSSGSVSGLYRLPVCNGCIIGKRFFGAIILRVDYTETFNKGGNHFSRWNGLISLTISVFSIHMFWSWSYITDSSCSLLYLFSLSICFRKLVLKQPPPFDQNIPTLDTLSIKSGN